MGQHSADVVVRERLLGSFLDKRAISNELVQKLLAWRHPGFAAHVGEPIVASDRQRLEDTAAYIGSQPPLEYQRSQLLYYSKHCGVLQRTALRVLMAARASLQLAAGAVSGDLARCREAATLLRLSLTGRSTT